MQKQAFSIYDASAGAGKTFTLVKEYLKILLTSPKQDAYRNILAITFTNKAVGEMKSRIVSNLSEFCKDSPNIKAQQLIDKIVEETNLNPIEIKQKARQIIKNLIHNYAAFDISTIDKFTHKVIRAFAHDLGLPPLFEISLETENLLAEAVDSLIAKAGEDQLLTKLLVDFTMEKTDNDKSWDISYDIFQTGKLLLNEDDRTEIQQFENFSLENFGDIKNKIKQNVEQLEEKCVLQAQKILQTIADNNINETSFFGEFFPKHLRAIAENKFNPRNKTYHEPEDIKIKKAAPDKPIIEALIPEMLQEVSEIYQTKAKINFFQAFLKNITPLSLLNKVSQELNRIQDEQNILSIAEFNSIIHREIQNQPAPFIYERLGEKYRHFFIDEFQDTSEMQWQNLIPLIGNALAGQDEYGNQGSLMIVGDPKQSIYRWRGGKAEQFIELAKNNSPFPHQETKLEHLAINYRSYSEVIEFNNRFFKLISEKFENEDYRKLYFENSHQETNSKKGGYVNISFIKNVEESESEEQPEKSQLYCEAVLKTIREVESKGFTWAEIAILTRKKNEGIELANYLTQHNIDILSSETLMIANATEVIFVINTLRYLNNVNNREAKAGMLFFIGQFFTENLPLHDFIAAGMQTKSETEFEHFLQLYDFKISLSDVKKKSLYESVETIISTFVKQKADNAYLQYFLDIVLERDMKNSAGAIDFLSYWDKNGQKFSIPSPEGKNAVKIMTIHKSKGLEFPVVIFPFAEDNYSRTHREKMWLDNPEESIEIPRVLLNKNQEVKSFGDAAAALFHQKNQETLLDNINVLYVAMTRAEEQLYIISSKNISKKGEFPSNNMCRFFIDYIQYFEDDQNVEKFEYHIGNSEKISERKNAVEASKKVPYITQLLQPKAIKIAQREALMWGGKQLESIEYGNIVHEILSWIKTENDLEKALEKAIENALITVHQVEQVKITLLAVIHHPELQEAFLGNTKILNEQLIIAQNASPIKPDKMVIRDDKSVFLIDYKTGTHLPKYKQQLDSYQYFIEEMGFVVAKKSLVYIGEEVKVVNL
ncbi:UvrD-helicase domain-containing protein [Flavobacterium sp. NST-5]|uniref:DNA 3'-5' helicase n=1 Tax=Flavobacterium ichthyis TaxID=2698827 RepID=A0ABW9Z8Q7_9FLAO|nr:UvrD-helicase domain-containing protein [Flavobacterium ichthyis]NBL64957.1 UvrD-helicase domain-containing protein [Flavobacterium ichthyis]